MAFTLTGTEGVIYVNGKKGPVSTTAVPRSVLRTANYLGKDNWGSSLAVCEFDDLKIFNRSLTQTEILKVLNQNKSLVSAGHGAC